MSKEITTLDLLNCVAESNNITSTDVIQLDIRDQRAPLDGISTINMVLIQRHILALEPFQDECSLWAADVTNSSGVNGTDLIELRKLILGIYTELPQAVPDIYFRNGDINQELIFTGSEFPLSQLEISSASKGNVRR